ncbi:MAG: hypothetical protein LBG65_05770 [Puniceicoccales bacterium]|jgi:hypothetical protein|nr:hypothetical protein [Puniceicoccales bacterium]
MAQNTSAHGPIKACLAAALAAILAATPSLEAQDATTTGAAPALSPLPRPEDPATPQKSTSPMPAAERSWLFEALPENFSSRAYRDSIEKLFNAFEQHTGKSLAPAKKRKAVIKINTAAGAGLFTPQPLVTAVIRALLQRGYPSDGILVVDLSERRIRECGYPCVGEQYPVLTPGIPLKILADFPVHPLDSEKYYSPRWAVESPLPSREITAKQGDYTGNLEILEKARRSSLPAPLFEDADLWISLPVAMDSPSLGVSCALANETIWNVSNQRRFLENPIATPEAAIEIARTLEGSRPETLVLHVLSLEKWQYTGGPVFNSNYTASEKRLWLSANPVILDALMLQRINKAREYNKFPPITPAPSMFTKANSLPQKEITPAIALGSPNPSEITLVQVDKPPATTKK